MVAVLVRHHVAVQHPGLQHLVVGRADAGDEVAGLNAAWSTSAK
jgi:hypothetical protein